MRRETTITIVLSLVIIGLISVGIYYGYQHIQHPKNTNLANKVPTVSGLTKFTSAEEFALYVQQGVAAKAANGVSSFITGTSRDLALEDTGLTTQPTTGPTATGASRVSTTNVQVAGIDEPDVVKNNDRNIFISNEAQYVVMDDVTTLTVDPALAPSSTGSETAPSGTVTPPIELQNQTRVLNVFPPETLEKISTIARGGTLLLSDKTLIVFTSDGVTGYNISNPSAPTERWSIEQTSGTERVDARLKDNTLYLITRTSLANTTPCPIEPLRVKDVALPIPCNTIYHPVKSVPVDSTFTVLAINPQTGSINQKTSFVGSANTSVMAMFENNLYITYTYSADLIELVNGFLAGPGHDLFPATIQAKFQRLESYDLSASAKMTEFEVITQSYFATLSDNDRLKHEKNLSDRMSEYTTTHAREIERTGIAKIDLSKLTVTATGDVPGAPLNQYSLDEYNGYLRLATTTGGQFTFGATGQSANDVYVLNNKLETVGSVLDLGQNESIYAVRFLGNRGYLVTFKQTDPFYVLDLTDPKKPAKRGELKIPGYSGYLHPLKDNIILGVGQESNTVKLALYDVSNAAAPVELDKYLLDEYWSEAVNNPRAFLQDAKHNIFFVPGSNGGYVFSYTNNKLGLKATVSGYSINRAVYLNDFLYIVGESKITVLDESTWQIKKELGI